MDFDYELQALILLVDDGKVMTLLTLFLPFASVYSNFIFESA
jgi:hypothetical protein